MATFNCSLNRDRPGKLTADMQTDTDEQIRKVARILRIVRPHVVLLNEFDFDASAGDHQTEDDQTKDARNGDAKRNRAVHAFLENYVSAAAHWAPEPPLNYPWTFTAPVNTGIPSGRDFDHNGRTDDPADAIGYGRFPGQYGMVILSQFPIEASGIRTFQKFLWKSMPDANLPTDPGKGGTPWYDDDDLRVLRLSSKSHWDVPVTISGHVVHFLASHPTPPAFDGPEDRNGRRNHDEIRFWSEYLSGGPRDWMVDDQGGRGPLSDAASFVVLGDLNADPIDGDSYRHAVRLLLEHPRIPGGIAPRSLGAAEAAQMQGRANLLHRGDPALDTADFNDRVAGNLRVDYVLPSRCLPIQKTGVFWPTASDPQASLIDCSDHRLVWADLTVPPAEELPNAHN